MLQGIMIDLVELREWLHDSLNQCWCLAPSRVVPNSFLGWGSPPLRYPAMGPKRLPLEPSKAPEVAPLVS